MCEIALSGLACFIVGFVLGRIEHYLTENGDQQGSR